MGNRPINRRPWRRKPWAKGKRPTRWNSATNGQVDCLVNNTTVYCNDGDGNPRQPVVVICDGAIDVEPWADAQDVTVDRIVGDIILYGYAVQPAAPSAYQNSMHSPIVKLGVLLDQELSGTPPAGLQEVPEHDLWSQEDLEDLPWMWLQSVMPEQNGFSYVSPTTGTGFYTFRENIHVDIGVRRKLGGRDALNLYASWSSPAPDFNTQVLLFADLRCILMSK